MLDAQGVEQEYRGWIYRDLLRPIAEVDSEGNVTARYVYLDGAGSRQNGMHQLATRLGANQDTSLPFAGSNVPEYVELLDESGAVTQALRLIVNQVGTVQAVVDAATGDVVQRLEHDEFGRVLLDSNPGLQPFGFAGGLVDADTGLVRFGARDYEPLVGRWTARDPVRPSSAIGRYRYASDDPVNRKDSNGFWDIVDASDVHKTRNQFNDCPPQDPNGSNGQCGGSPVGGFGNGGSSSDGDPTPDTRTWSKDWWGSGKTRGSDGSECIYDNDGNLIGEGSFNFCPNAASLCHVINDVLPHFVFGEENDYFNGGGG